MLWINKEYISRIVKRFQLDLVPARPESLPFYPLVLPVTQVDELLKITKLAKKTGVDLSAAAGSKIVFFTVPDGKRWWIRYWSTTATVANTNIYVDDGTVDINVTVPATTAVRELLTQLVPLEEGMTLGLLTTGNGGDTSEGMNIIYTEEDSY